jgi:hypothetical protein
MIGGLSRSTQPRAMIFWKSSKGAMTPLHCDHLPASDRPLARSAIRPAPTPFWTVSSTTLIASNSPAKACVGPKQSNRGRLDPTPQPVTTIYRPARLATRAASFRNPWRRCPVTPGRLRRNRQSLPQGGHDAHRPGIGRGSKASASGCGARASGDGANFDARWRLAGA